MVSGKSSNARRYKSNDIDSDGDGQVDGAEYAVNSDTVDQQHAEDIVGKSQANDLLAGSLHGTPISGTYASDTVYSVPNGEIWAVRAIAARDNGVDLAIGGVRACEWNSGNEYARKGIPLILSGGTNFEFKFGPGMMTGYEVAGLVDKPAITYALLSDDQFTVPAGETYRGWAIADPGESPDIEIDSTPVAGWSTNVGYKQDEVMFVLNEGTTYKSAFGQSVFTGWKL